MLSVIASGHAGWRRKLVLTRPGKLAIRMSGVLEIPRTKKRWTKQTMRLVAAWGGQAQIAMALAFRPPATELSKLLHPELHQPTLLIDFNMQIRFQNILLMVALGTIVGIGSVSCKPLGAGVTVIVNNA